MAGHDAADPKVQVLRGGLVNHHLPGMVRQRLAAREQLRDLQQVAVSAVQRRGDYGLLIQRAAGSRRQRMQPGERRDRRHTRKLGQGIVIAAESAAGRGEEHVGPR
jgi:hypothetical protein